METYRASSSIRLNLNRNLDQALLRNAGRRHAVDRLALQRRDPEIELDRGYYVELAALADV